MKYQIIIGLVLLGIGFGAGHYFTPTKIITKTETVVKTNDIIHDHIKTIIRTITNPDGTTDSTTTIDNNSVEVKNSSSESNSSSVTTYEKPQWKAQGLVGLNFDNTTIPIYGVGIERRIIGPISAGLWGNTNKEAGLSVSLEF